MKLRARAARQGRKALVVLVVVALHLAVLAAMSIAPKTTPTPQAEAGLMTVALFDLAAPRALPTPEAPTSKPPRPDRPPSPTAEDRPASAPLLPPTPPPLDVVAMVRDLAVADPTAHPLPLSQAAAARPEAAVTASQTADHVSTCQMTEQLQARLAADPQVSLALAHIPRGARSVANALMLWDGAWVGSGRDDQAQALDVIRGVIVEAIATAAPDCRALPVLGPRLLSIPDPSGATLLVVGSGAWRWDDLLATPSAPIG